MRAPILHTERLTLSPPAPADLEDEAVMWADPGVYAMIGGRAFSREEVWHRLLRYIGHWQVCGYGTWIVRETDTGGFAGSVGLMDSRRATEPSYEGTPEAGWAFSPAVHGRGYAREAMAALLGWGDRRFARTVCIIDPANAPSIRLAEAIGYRPTTRATYRDTPTLLFERTTATRAM
ncbi:MAG TPA: GNAT family N-acetyltransferase [Sphingomonas sp.]|jgi:RimJ/RimL family protein N-acetyltransferase|nr:GNAT family N-acetyltransferase [Sphingomonas sp.]